MSEWQPIETAPKDTEALFWVVPKTADEAFLDTSLKSIFTAHTPYIMKGKARGWSSLSKATHWAPLPDPPQ